MFKVSTEKNNNFLKLENFYSGSFLQSKLWQDFLDKQQKKNWQINITDEKGELFLSCLLYENKLPFGKSYLYAPKGPVLKNDLKQEDKQELLALFFSKTRDLMVETKTKEEIFLQLEPSEEIKNFFQVQTAKNIQPQDVSFLTLDKEPKEMLANMHQKTRYNIMLANKKGVKVEVLDKPEDIEIFLSLNKKTAARQNIITHPDNYYALLWQTLLEHKAAKLFVAYYNDKPVAANLMIFWENTATYLHGASDYEYRQAMAPYLLQWEAIKLAREQGFAFYDFGGIAPEDNSKPKWNGLTRFKKGFAGSDFHSPVAQVFVYNPGQYKLYLLAKKILKLIKP